MDPPYEGLLDEKPPFLPGKMYSICVPFFLSCDATDDEKNEE